MPTKNYVIYSFRHSFEQRMLKARLDYGLRCRLMGHAVARPDYGGTSIRWRHEQLTAMGRVISVNKPSGMITIEHGPIKALDWPTMIMPFMADPKHLTSIKKGDFVDIKMMGKPNQDGNYVITNIDTINIDRSKLSKACVSMMDNIKFLDYNCMADIREAIPHGHLKLHTDIKVANVY